MKLTTIKALNNIKAELHVPKTKSHEYLHFKFRNVEDILTVLNPLLKKFDGVVLFNEEVTQVEPNSYLLCTASFHTADDVISSSTWVRLDNNIRRGLCSEQQSGGSISYARRYALCGLFGLGEEDCDSLPAPSKGYAAPIRSVAPVPPTDWNTKLLKGIADGELLKVRKALPMVAHKKLLTPEEEDFISGKLRDAEENLIKEKEITKNAYAEVKAQVAMATQDPKELTDKEKIAAFTRNAENMSSSDAGDYREVINTSTSS